MARAEPYEGEPLDAVIAGVLSGRRPAIPAGCSLQVAFTFPEAAIADWAVTDRAITSWGNFWLGNH
jgi:hypothetical protein